VQERRKDIVCRCFQFSAINICMLAKIQELLANIFKNSKTIFDSMKPLQRNSRLSTLSSISTQIEAKESSKEDDIFSVRLEKFDNDIDYTLESSTQEGKNEHRKPIAVKRIPVSKMIL
jgi:hypothetical protein